MADDNGPLQRQYSTSAAGSLASKNKVHRSASMPSMKGAATAAAAAAGVGVPGGNNIRVAVRCRPMNADEKAKSALSAIACDIETNSVVVNYQAVGKKVNRTVPYDKVFGVYSKQSEVFDTMVRPIVDETLAGYNCTIFAYGPTGTGKTHTMEGDIRNEDSWGMIPRAARYIFESLADARFDFNLKISYLEIYNEELRDLLNTSIEKPKLRLQEDLTHMVVCKGLEEFSVNSVESCMEYLRRGTRERQTAATFSNQNSSRSHSIFTFKLLVRETVAVGEEIIRTGQLNLVDLAGSECIGISGSRGETAVEAGNINKSLLTLGRVITALVDLHPHIPYRDSKLTRLLSESLGGKAKTMIIATVSPSASSLDESLSTLEYAARARYVKNAPTINSTSVAKHVMKDLHYELEALKSQLQLSRDKNGVYLDPREYEELLQKLQSQTLALSECEATLVLRDQEVKEGAVKQAQQAEEIKRLQEENAQLNRDLSDLTSLHNDNTARLAVMYVHLQSQRQIVVEQQQSERRLRQQGAQLEEVVAQRDEDIRRLQERIRLLETQETTRQQQATTFLETLVQHTSSLRSSASALDIQTQTQAAQFHLLTQTLGSDLKTFSNNWQTQLQQVLQRHFTDEVEPAFEQVQEMTRATLPQQLKTDTERLQQDVAGLREQWQVWLQETQQHLLSAEQVSLQQEEQLRALQVSCDEASQALTALVSRWQTEHRERQEVLVNECASFAASLETHVNQAQAQTLQTTQAARTLFAQQITSFQQQLQSMWEQMATTHDTLCQDIEQQTQTAHRETQSIGNKHVTLLQSLVQTTHAQQQEATFASLQQWQTQLLHETLPQTHLPALEASRKQLQTTVQTQLLPQLTTLRDETLPTQTTQLTQRITDTQTQLTQHFQTLDQRLAQTRSHTQSLVTHISTQQRDTLDALQEWSQSTATTWQAAVASASEQVKSLVAQEEETLKAEDASRGEYEEQMQTSLAPHRGDTPLNLPVSPEIDWHATRDLAEIIGDVVDDFAQHDAVDGSWREALQQDDVAPRELQDLPEIALAQTMQAVSTQQAEEEGEGDQADEEEGEGEEGGVETETEDISPQHQPKNASATATAVKSKSAKKQ